MSVPSSWGIFVYKPEKSIDTRIVKSFRLDCSLYPMSRDQFSIFGFDHVVEVFGRSCLTNIVLFSGPWTNTSKLATRMGSFFGQAQAVNTNHVWSWRRHDRKCRTKRRTSTRVKPSEKWQSRLWERTGSYAPISCVFIFSYLVNDTKYFSMRRKFSRWKLVCKFIIKVAMLSAVSFSELSLLVLLLFSYSLIKFRASFVLSE